VVRGQIVRIVEFDAFVELEDGIDGLIAASELSWANRHQTPSEFFKVGDAVDVMVLEIDPEERRISLMG
jgi:small subunit ribosomal protein S1